MPAAAVIRRVRALSGITGRKGLLRWFIKSYLKYRGLTSDLGLILVDLRDREGDGIAGGAVKCVDISKNTKGVGNLLAVS